MTDGINILMYHQVGDFAPMKGHRSTYCHYKRFAAQMRWLARGGYRVLGMDEVAACVRGERSVPPRAVALTFDDGYENFYQYAYPELARHGFSAIVYLISDLIGKPASWFAADGRPTPPLMNAERIRELHRAGIDFGSHGATHVKLADQDQARLVDEVTRSKARLEELLGEPIRHLCYPYGSYDIRTLEATASAGYETATTCVRALTRPGDDLLALPRKAISYGDNLVGYWWKLAFKNRAKIVVVRR